MDILGVTGDPVTVDSATPLLGDAAEDDEDDDDPPVTTPESVVVTGTTESDVSVTCAAARPAAARTVERRVESCMLGFVILGGWAKSG